MTSFSNFVTIELQLLNVISSVLFMTKVKEYRLAIKFRKQGKSYSQIKKKLKLSKSTLSRWLKNYPLSKERINELRGDNQIRIEKFRNTMFIKRQKKLINYYKEQKKILLPLTEKEIFVSGLFLYWGEGNKATRNVVSLNNTDPNVLKFTLLWYLKGLKVKKEKIKVFLHLYDDMNVEEEKNYWSNILNIPLSNFDKPYIKKSSRKNIDQKGFGHGTCGLRFYNTITKDKILMGLNAISDFYSKKLAKI